MAPLDGLPGILGAVAPFIWDPAILLTAVHPDALRPGSTRHPKEEEQVGTSQTQLQRQRIGQIEDATQTAEFQDVLQQEADLTAGHGILRYTGLISVSARTADELDAAVAAIEQAAIQASCETRLLVGQQAQAFTAAALPLCRVV